MEKVLLVLGICVLCIVLGDFLKKYAPEYVLPMRICVSVLILCYMIADINGIYEKFETLIPLENESKYLTAVAKTSGICFVGQWGSSICRDAGEISLAEKAEAVTKITVTVMCLPFIEEIFKLATMIE